MRKVSVGDMYVIRTDKIYDIDGKKENILTVIDYVLNVIKSFDLPQTLQTLKNSPLNVRNRNFQPSCRR